MHDNTLTPGNREKFSCVAERYNQLVKFYNVEELCAEKISEMIKLFPAVKTSHVTIAALYRLLIPQLLPAVEKCIYLDSDIIVNLDINELWQIELGDKVFGAIPELSNGDIAYTFVLCRDNIVKAEDYFNSGVMLMNLKVLRGKEDLILDGVKWRGEHTQCNFFDQDILNYLFANDYLKLENKFDFFVREARHLKETKFYRRIYHYAGGNFREGLALDTSDAFNRLWIKYFVKTPWFNEETIERLYLEVRQTNVDLKDFAVKVSAAMSGKTRAFFILLQNADAMKKFFSVRDDEEIILADIPNSLQKLIDAMKLSAGKKIFFIVIPEFPFQILVQAGFVPGRDFLNGMAFLSEAHGVPLDSYPLIKSM